MRAYTRGERCLMQLLQEALDDPTAAAVRAVLGVPGRGCPTGIAGAALGGGGPRGRRRAARRGARRGAAQDVAGRGVRRAGPHPRRPPGRRRAGRWSSPTRRSGARWSRAVFARDAGAPDEVVRGCIDLLSRWSDVVGRAPGDRRRASRRRATRCWWAAWSTRSRRRGRLPAAGARRGRAGARRASPRRRRPRTGATRWPCRRTRPGRSPAGSSCWWWTPPRRGGRSPWRRPRLREAGAGAVLPLVLHLRP